MKKTKREFIMAAFSVRTYDVWGNARDGYDVNDSFSAGTVTLRLPVEICNPGTPREFRSAFPSDKQLREALDVKPRVRLRVDGDDTHIYVNHESTDYPFGELYCESHESLSPIRERTDANG